MFRPITVIILALMLCTAPAGRAQAGDPSQFIPFELLSSAPHDPKAFTQGLALMPGETTDAPRLFESTGRWGRSTIRELDPKTGRILRSVPLLPIFFGEGLAVHDNTLIQLTWKSERGFFRDPDTLKKTSGFTYTGEGWGLALCPGPGNASPVLVRSSGIPRLVLHEPTAFAEIGGIEISDRGEPVEQINELECAEGYLLFNIWHSDVVGLADLKTGEVRAKIDFSPLRKKLSEPGGALNGLAWDPARRTLMVTGKNWDRIFTVRVPFLYESP